MPYKKLIDGLVNTISKPLFIFKAFREKLVGIFKLGVLVRPIGLLANRNNNIFKCKFLNKVQKIKIEK